MRLLYTVPNRSIRISTLLASRSRRGRNWMCWNPSRLARRVTSSSTPLARNAQWTGWTLRHVASSKYITLKASFGSAMTSAISGTRSANARTPPSAAT
jgi:hypothetical protein